jgi:hypothetical protein
MVYRQPSRAGLVWLVEVLFAGRVAAHLTFESGRLDMAHTGMHISGNWTQTCHDEIDEVLYARFSCGARMAPSVPDSRVRHPAMHT